MSNEVETTLTLRQSMVAAIWDMGKDVTGIRPRWIDFDSMSDDDIVREYDHWVAEYDRSVKEDHIREAEAQARFERRLVDMMALGAADRERAIRWLAESVLGYELSEGPLSMSERDSVEYYFELPIGYLKGA